MFYEHKNSSSRDFFTISQNIATNFSFPLHLHENYEFIYVEKGLLNVEINGFAHSVSGGQGALILPNQPHAFSTPDYSQTWLVIFSPDHISEFKKALVSKGLYSPVINFNNRKIREEFLSYKDRPLRLRSLLYEIAAIYCEGEPAPHLTSNDSDNIGKIIEYIDLHYTEQITLEDLSSALGYSYRYMSGIVNRFFKLPFPQIVNRYRVSHACNLLVETETNITELALLCGFSSMRSFNRNFKIVMGITPREYRNGISKP